MFAIANAPKFYLAVPTRRRRPRQHGPGPSMVAGWPPRLPFVHAHPDDESLWTGGTIARHIAAGGDAPISSYVRGRLVRAGTPRWWTRPGFSACRAS